MKKIIRYSLIFFALGLFTMPSCVNDLDVAPLDTDQVTTAVFYDNPESYKQLLAKVYGGLALTGQQGPAGQGDLAGVDEGESSYLRAYWKHQELPTDEAVIGWNDRTIKDFSDLAWDVNDVFVQGMYARIFFQITLANELIREAADGKLADRGISGAAADEVRLFRAEARFLRALSYWHALDLFANPPFVTDANSIGAFLPEQTNRRDLFNYLETELLALEEIMAEPMQNEYARADRAAAWMLLAKLYLNAEVYIGEPKFTECITYCNKIISAGYSLEPVYQHLFLADNDLAQGVIFTIAFDGLRTQSFGGTTFLINAATGGTMDRDLLGIPGNGWGGTRTTSALTGLFPNLDGSTDNRALFHTDGQSVEIDDIAEFTEGIGVVKFKNVDRNGNQGSHPLHPDTDFPMFRLADVYLMYAEAVLRGGGGGDAATAVNYINQLRERAYGNNEGNITGSSLNLDFILDERARELYWECHRRTDLVRYNRLTTGQYIWPWKGGVKEGRSVDDKYNIYPIPSSDITTNPNLVQNPGY